MLCDVYILSFPQTMRRQRTEVVVELRKVSSFGVKIAFLSLETSPKNALRQYLHM